ncbi:MAG: heavy metal-binding domain-containing protein [Polyangiales bacterium]
MTKLILPACLLLSSCASGELPPREANDPANPAAEEAKDVVATPAPPEPTASTSPATATTYVCPMHPEVTSNVPGNCPKCGMKLVPKKEP